MKNITLKMVVLVLIFSGSLHADEQDYLVTVSGIAEVNGRPDRSYITLYAEAEEHSISYAIKKVDDLVEDIGERIKKDARIRGDVLVVDTAFSGELDSKDGSVLFQAARRLRITCNFDPDEIYDVIDAGEKAGALIEVPACMSSSVKVKGVVVYGIEKSQRMIDDLREAAIKDARAEAEKVVKLVGKAVGEVVRISSSSPDSLGEDTDLPTRFVDTNPDQIKLSYKISVSYELKDVEAAE